ncbi:uncharacterized protein J4E88_006230 [Alternaria novae-zelandiae]|uniref:uncharacterized protein n=1 Tax=Alternaria novae-zelandiae TaxID=430562 RepID=UPI0020C38617|nr:uncharacterized protein J4E88_006230 [Alternaria novae-zelandiae]KAI4678942.1 hypothetical protein J4E88_006230 [Alternaria novae-zelandiae]
MTVANDNLAEIQANLGALLDNAPYDEVIKSPQTYEPGAISFKIRFGHIIDKQSKTQQEVWVLLYPPINEKRHAEVRFHSFHPDTGALVWYDESNISTTVSTLADAFRNPKKATKHKHVALAKYYYLKALATKETETETETGRASELKIPIPITQTLLESLRVVCWEFEEEAKKLQSDTLGEGDGSDLSDPPDDLLKPTQQPVDSVSIVTPNLSHIPTSNSQQVDTLLAALDEEIQLQSSNNKLVNEKTELETARQEIAENLQKVEEELQRREQQLRANDEERASIEIRRKQVVEGLSAADAFELGRSMEREVKRRKLD